MSPSWYIKTNLNHFVFLSSFTFPFLHPSLYLSISLSFYLFLYSYFVPHGDFSNPRGVLYKHVSLELPEGLEEIGSESFMDCFELIYAALENGGDKREAIEIENIDEYKSYLKHPFNVAKKYYYGLVSVKIPSTCKVIGKMAFKNCSGLSTVILSEGVESIGAEAFYNCGYYFYYYSVDVELLKEKNYNYNDYLHLISNSDDEDIYKEYTKTVGLSSIKSPSSLKYIDNKAFASCDLLESIEIPENLEYVGKNVFANCSLRNISLPNNVAWFKPELNIFGKISSLYLKTLTTSDNIVASNLISKINKPIENLIFKGSEDEFLNSNLYESLNLSPHLSKVKIEFLGESKNIDWVTDGSNEIDFDSFE